ncbi:MAG TPA: substrate-binding domain-containing protein [Solirubrobacterales bacterium]
MSAFKQKLARLGATAGVLAAGTAAFMAVGGATASSAFANPTCVAGKEVVLQGEGSTLQNVAQGLWTGVYNEKCPKSADINFKYTGTGSGAALKAFGYTNAGTINTGEAYVGTDEAPTAAEIKLVHEKNTTVNPVIVPVAQTSIAVVVNKPAGCVIKNGLEYTDLNKLFNGEIKKWSEISTIENKATCESAETGEIKRVVRKDGSGTTYQFKNYLSELETGQGAASPGNVALEPVGHPTVCTAETWANLRPNPTMNLLWPEKGCKSTLTNVEKAEGGGGLVEFVKNNANTIGYASYSDVFAKGATSNAVPLRSGHSNTTGNLYASPHKATLSEANCGVRTYTVPTGASSGREIDWSEIFGANPTIGTSYPLCTLTFDLSWHNYAGKTGYTSTTGKAVHAYLAYALNTAEGQAKLNENGYETLPSNVLTAAEAALAKVE